MKILVLEDAIFKREQITDFLKEKNIPYQVIEYLNPALKYVFESKEEISGIILDLGLQLFKDAPETYSLYRGLDLVYELARTNLEIPVLINSSTDVGMLTDYPFVYGQRTKVNNYQILEDFINFLKQNEKR